MSERSFSRALAVIGAGAWGTTLAWLAARNGASVRLWARRGELAREITQTRRNRQYAPDIELPPQIAATSDLSEALDGAEIAIVAVPSFAFRCIVERARAWLQKVDVVVSATKGLECGTLLRMTQVLEQAGGVAPEKVAALSGPNLSAEVRAGLPAASVIACRSAERAEKVRNFLGSRLFRLYTNSDIIGVELAGALKNVIALAAGMCDGAGLGTNAKAAVITRGLAELARLGVAAGAREQTFFGLAGVGDLLATSNSRLSRNWRAGYLIAGGASRERAEAEISGVAEGINTCAAAFEMANRLGVDAPVTAAVYRIVWQGASVREVAAELLARPWRSEW